MASIPLNEIDLNVLRMQAAKDPGQLNADQKNALIRASIADRHAASGRRDSDAAAYAAGGTPARLQEASVVNSYDPDAHLGPFSGGTSYMRQILGDKIKLVERKELPPHVREKVQKVAGQLWDGSPLARRFIVRLVNYLLGDGISVQAKHDDEGTKKKIQAVIDGFWKDSRNKMNRRLPGWLMALEAYGELALTATVNPATGLVRLAYIGVSRILDVKSEDGDIEHLTELHLRKGAAGSDADPDVRQIVRPDESDPQAGKRVYGRLNGAAFYWGINNLPDMVRGRPSQLVVADFLDADDQLVWNLLERTAFGNAFIWDITMTGADDDKITAWRRENGSPPKPGSVQVHNDKVTYEPKAVDLKSQDSVTQHDLLVGIIALAHGMPAMWFTAQNDPNRANGENLTGPTLKDMTAKQRQVREIISDLVSFVIDRAVALGILPEDIVASEAFTVEMPDLSASDTAAAAAALASIVAAMAMAVKEHFATREVAVRLLAMILAQMGLEVDAGELLEQATKEGEEADKKAAELADPYGGQKGQGGQALPPQAGQQGAQGGAPRPGGRQPLGRAPLRLAAPAGRAGGADGSERKAGGR